jgi:hypothetical protein
MIDTRRQTTTTATWIEAGQPSRAIAPARQVTAVPTHRPARASTTTQARQPLPPVGLIPYTAALVGSLSAQVDPATVRVLDKCEGVWLVGFALVNMPDPVIPIVGFGHITARELLTVRSRLGDELRHNYGGVVHALSMWRGDMDYWRRYYYPGMASSVNRLLALCDDAVFLSDNERRYVTAHLIGACREPGRYAQ